MTTEVKDDLRGWRLGRVVTVVDRGFCSDENLRYLSRAGALDRRRTDARRVPDTQEVLSRQGRRQTVRDNLRVKEVRVGDGDGAKRFVVCHNPAEAERDKTARDETIARLQAELDRIATARAKSTSVKASDAHHCAECALRDHPTLGRYCARRRPRGCGSTAPRSPPKNAWTASTCSAPQTPTCRPEDVALGYKNLLEAERGFRDLKTTLELRPVFHRPEHRIRAHVLICWLALLLIRIAEGKTGQTWRRIALELQRLHLATLQGPDGTVQQTTPLTDPRRQILDATAVKAAPWITTLEPV